MRISFSGAACTGKTTIVSSFLQKWTTYSYKPSKYRDIIKGTNNHSKKTSVETQQQILDILVEENKGYTLHDKVVFDRCPLDNLVYTFWAHGKEKEGFTEKFVVESINKVKESMRNLDIIFVCTRDFMPPIEPNGVRETDPVFIDEINNIFKAISKQSQFNIDSLPFFPKEDSPTLIDLYGSVEERLAQIELYVDSDGNMFGEDKSLLNVDELVKMEEILKEQNLLLEEDKKTKPNIILPK